MSKELYSLTYSRGDIPHPHQVSSLQKKIRGSEFLCFCKSSLFIHEKQSKTCRYRQKLVYLQLKSAKKLADRWKLWNIYL